MEGHVNGDIPRQLGDRDETGATSVEYALMVSLIALVIFTAVGMLGLSLKQSFENDCVQLFGVGSC